MSDGTSMCHFGGDLTNPSQGHPITAHLPRLSPPTEKAADTLVLKTAST